jgi:hypothetical protein
LLSSNIYIKKARNGREFSEDGSASGRASTGGASWDGAICFFLFVFLVREMKSFFDRLFLSLVVSLVVDVR